MGAHLDQWLSLTLRWAHVIVGVAWIGTSFYFNWLNTRLQPPEPPEPGVGGELWSVHGGGLYRVVKYTVAPANFPQTLHWFKWEAYTTWLTGIALLILLYWLGARVRLIDPEVARISVPVAIGISVATLSLAWLAYDLLCRSGLERRPVLLGAAFGVLVTALAFALTQAFSARAAYLHVGAALGTIMAANVWRVIIPAQRDMVSALTTGQEPDAARGKQAAMRSVHNNYFTLPVLFVMISGHYPVTYGHPWSWALLAGLFAAGVATRHWFNLRNQGRRNRWLLPAAGTALLALAVITAPRRTGAAVADDAAAQFARVRVIVAQRCAPCHSAAPTYPGFAAAPAGVMFDTPEQLRSRAPRIAERAVTTKTMPLGNLTGMTPEERQILGAWVRSGARVR